MRHLPELQELERILEGGTPYLETRQACVVELSGNRFPVYAISLGGKNRENPAVGFFGGVHGLECIGTQVLLVFLKSLIERLQWDDLLHRQLESVRLVFMPLINPGGMWRNTRANPKGVDLMRNAPLDATEKVPFLLGGQRISTRLPWYRGEANTPMEMESHAVCQVVQEELLPRRFSLALDCHSGFGMRDRIWFPYAHTVKPIPHLSEIHALKQLFDRSHPHHNYLFEPQSRQYLTHGDLWDYLYRGGADQNRVFLPLTLEMGSWLWIKKSPWQVLTRQGIFNPLPIHRTQRVLRRHLPWLDFLTRAACAHQRWLPTGAERDNHLRQAHDCWYSRTPA